MNYSQTIDWIFKQVPQFQKVGKTAYKADLTNSLTLAKHFNHPENTFKSIHIAGTNGKGSTSSMIASILQEAGYKVGLFTSPHLKDFRERIKINGEMLPESFVVDFISENQAFISQHSFSFFELTFALATVYFAQQKVDVAVIETGLGGRLDSTNIIRPLVSVITNIGFDHQNILGNTLEQIAEEKAGIIKKQIPVVIGEYTKETQPIFVEKAEKEHAPIWFAQDGQYHKKYRSDLKGIYQQKNIQTALVAINCLKSTFVILEEHISNGLLKVVQNTGLQGRWQSLHQQPLVIADTAHNLMGIQMVVEQIKKQKYQQLHIVFGMVQDKDTDAVIDCLPKDAVYYLSCPAIPRGMPVDNLSRKFKQKGLTFQSFESIKKAYECALAQAQPDDFIYVGGSTFVVAEII